MLVSQIDYNLIADIVSKKEAVKQSVDGVLDNNLTAAHLASEVYALLDELDKLEQMWRATPPSESTAMGTQAPPQQAPQPAPASEIPEEPVVPEATAAEQEAPQEAVPEQPPAEEEQA